MPAGVSMGQYLKFFTSAMLAMMAGSQVVHMYYKPLEDLDAYIEQELKQEKLPEAGDVDKMEKNNVHKSGS